MKNGKIIVLSCVFFGIATSHHNKYNRQHMCIVQEILGTDSCSSMDRYRNGSRLDDVKGATEQFLLDLWPKGL